MRRFCIFAAAIAALTFLVVAHSQSRKPQPSTNPLPVTAPQTFDRAQLAQKTITTQQRINRYFHSDVVPKLKPCWSRLQGRGTIEIKYTYDKGPGNSWVPNAPVVSHSTLTKEQEAAALQCMRNSVQSTSFPVEPDEAERHAFIINWTWPVPFPANSDQLVKVMLGRTGEGEGGGGGCDGHGTAARCYTCINGSCQAVCVGYWTCTVQHIPLFGHNYIRCESDDACASGGPFGVGGGGIIAN